ncbi:MAG: PQQ-binding-like beta-propeller repeat protein [Planctomycetaceae bacterium]|nr:PQQ-binding-like beta-propeller repeat protein [Planctomycetaceae bacterium]
MTDDELRKLIEEKSPADLTPEECAALRAAIRRSPQLLRDVADRIEIEEYLARALGRPQVTVERVLARLSARRSWSGGAWTRYGLVVCGVVAAVLGALVASRGWRDRPQSQEVARSEAQAPPAAPIEQTVAAKQNAEQRKTSAVTAEPAAADAAAPPPPADVAVEPTAAAPPLREVGLFEPPGADDATPDDKSLARWFAAVKNLPLKLSSQPIDRNPCGRLEGIARLRQPLVEGAALRMNSPDFTGVRIHVWSGGKGVSFDAFARPLQWQVYATVRSGSGPLPTGSVTLGRDDGRMIRTNPAGFHGLELRYADGLVTLARGDVRLVEAPLDAPPTDIFFEGAVTFRDLSLVAAVPIPPLREAAERPAADLLAAARDRWARGGDPSATFTLRDDGSAALAVKENRQPAWALLPLPKSTGLREIVVRLEGLMPGTGLVFGDGGVKQQSVLMVVANRNLPGVWQLQRMPPNNAAIESAEQIASQPLVLVKDRLWLRIRHCGGVQRVDMSADGTRWFATAEPQPAFSAIGLYAVPHHSARSITLAALQEAPFSRLESLCPADLRAAAVELPPQGQLAAWLAAADAAKPPTADADAWRRACGLEALSGNASKDLAVDLLGLLFRESLGMEMTPTARQDLLDDILAVAPVVDDPAAAGRIVSLFDDLGARMAMEGEERCYSAISHAQLTAPLRSGQPFVAFSEPLARREIVALVCRREWDSLTSLGRRLDFFGFFAKPKNEAFFNWAAAVARSGGEGRPWLIAAALRHPLLVAPSKESLRVEAEFNAALDGDDPQDAFRLIDAAVADGEIDLMPDRRDADLFLSLPMAVATVMRDEPRLLEAMRQDRERIAGLRVLEATAAADEAIVEATTVQFHGTVAAAQAHVWLGDRSMAAGRFVAARRHYEAASASIPEDDGSQRNRTLVAIDLARKLAAAMMASAAASGPSIVQAATITATPQARLEGNVGGNPARLPPPLSQGGVDWPPHAIDWAARQIAVLPLEDRLLVSNQFQLASHDPETGAVQWRAGLGGDAAGAHDWHGQAMRPCVDATRVYVRRLRKAGPAVAAIDRADGAVVWELPSTHDRQFVSDPLPGDGGTLAICLSRRVEDSFVLAIVLLDAATGSVLRETPLATFAGGVRCQIAEIDGGFAITGGGAVIACDERGRLRWVRREPWLPPPADGFSTLVAHAPIVAQDGRMYVVQPGVPGVVAVEAASGRVLWRLGDVAVSRLRGISRGRLVVERIGKTLAAGSTESGHADLVGVDAATGKVAWRYGPADLLDASLVTDAAVLAAVREPMAGKNARVATLVNLDPATGREMGRWPLAACEDPHPFLGPLVPAAGGLRVFFGRGPADATRDLILLEAAAP